MTTQQQEQQPDLRHERRTKRSVWVRWFIAGIILLFITVGTIIWIVTSQNAFTTIIPLVIFTVLGVLIALFQWLFPVSSTSAEHTSAPSHTFHVPQYAPVDHQVQPIIVHVPTPQPLPQPSSVPDTVSYRGIVGLPPPTDPRTIQQREEVVKAVYTKLIQPNITAIALTGIGGIGKSTLAALIYRYTEAQRSTQHDPFQAETLWLTVDPAVTFADLVGTLFEALGKPLPDLSSMAPHHQAVNLFNALNTAGTARLVILDQFENLLDWQTGHALADRPGIGEWLDIINSQQCRCRILLTSRPRPIGTREYPLTYIQEYPVHGLEMNEGIALLRNRGVHGTEEELRTAIVRCEGHVFSLTLLASLIHDHQVSLATLFKDPLLWIGDIARNLLDYIYTRQLNHVQRELLLAFSVYREPVSIEVAQAIMTSVPKVKVVEALKALRVQHLIEAVGEGHYHLHAIVANYAQGHFSEESEEANQEALRTAHAKAAQYYQQQAVKSCPPRDQRRQVSDVHEVIEAIWQYCQAGKRQEAYNLMEQEALFTDLHCWGGNAILLELYQLLLDDWHPEPPQRALIYNNLGEIYRVLGQNKQALKFLHESLEIYQEIGDRRGEAWVLNHLGRVHNPLGNKGQARTYYENSLDMMKQVGDRRGEATALTNLGWVYSDLGEMRHALEYHTRSLYIYREIGDRAGEGSALQGLGRAYYSLHQNEQARISYEQALSVLREVGDRGEEGVVLNSLGRLYLRLGQKEYALEYCNEGLSIVREVGDRGREGKALANLAEVYMVLGKLEYALGYYEQALLIYQEVGDHRGEGWTLYHLGRVYTDLGDKELVWKYYNEGLTKLRTAGDRWGEGRVLLDIAKLCSEEKQYNTALAFFLLARKIFERIQHPFYDEIQKQIEALHKLLGDEQFTALLAQVEPQAQQIVDQALGERMR